MDTSWGVIFAASNGVFWDSQALVFPTLTSPAPIAGEGLPRRPASLSKSEDRLQ